MCLTATSFVAILIRWRNGCFNWEMVYLFTIGLGMGVIYSAQFVAMSLDAPKGSLPTCITTYYLSQQLGFIIGPALGIAMVQRAFGARLSRELAEFGEKQVCTVPMVRVERKGDVANALFVYLFGAAGPANCQRR